MSGEKEQLREQSIRIEDLVSRLEEAEETLTAIRNGEVDALVIRAGARQHVFTLRGADHAYRVLFETLNEGALTLASDGTILYANSHLAEMLQLSHERVLGTLFTEHLSPPDRARFEHLLEEATRASSRSEFTLLREDGTPVPVILSLNCVEVESGERTCTGVVTDLTRLKETQAELQRTRDELEVRVEERTHELAEANAALRKENAARTRLAEELAAAHRRKDEFLSTLAHELRNPLAPIVNAIEALNLIGPPDPRAQRHRDIIQRQTCNLTRLVDDLLDVARITHGSITLRREPLDLGEIAPRAAGSTRPLIEAQGHELHLRLPDGPVIVEADPTRLEQILVNLLTNAAKYTEPGGRIELSVGVERGEGRSPAEAGAGDADPPDYDAPDHAVIRVRDSGVGIDPALLPHIFDLFIQAEQSLDRSRGGLGIGLTLVRRLVELHGGAIEGRSDGLGQGSEFVVRLPVHRPQPLVAAEASSFVDSQSRPLCVLLVDDNVDAAETLRELLQFWGHEVHIAHDGPAALALAAECEPEVVLLDIGLPGMDGYEVARRLRPQPGMRHAWIVALTGYGQEDDRRKAHAASFDVYLTKPVDAAVLKRLLEDVSRSGERDEDGEDSPDGMENGAGATSTVGPPLREGANLPQA